MIFKTRVGLCSCSESFEIRTYQYKLGDWWIFAQVREGEAAGRSLFRKARSGGSWYWYYLAAFINHANVEAEVGKTMQLITESIESAAPICDLSQVGSADAWGQKWKQVRWP